MPTVLSPEIICVNNRHSGIYPPQADTTTALKELHWTLCKLETTYPEAAFIVAGDFNKANLRKTLPKFYQHINCSTYTAKTLDHCYSNFRDAYKTLLRPPFGKSDLDSILLQDCFDHADWDMFRIASENDIDEYTDTGTEFIKRCIGDVVPNVTIKTYPNQKPWIDGAIRPLNVLILARLLASSEHAQIIWLVCLRTYSIAPYPSLLSPHASRWPHLFLYQRRQR